MENQTKGQFENLENGTLVEFELSVGKITGVITDKDSAGYKITTNSRRANLFRDDNDDLWIYFHEIVKVL